MGFFNKLKNLFKFKGWKEDEEIRYEEVRAKEKEQLARTYEEAEKQPITETLRKPEQEIIPEQEELLLQEYNQA